MFSSEFAEIIYCMPKEILNVETAFVNSLRKTVPGISIQEGIPNILELSKDKRSRLLILDDLMEESSAHPEFKKLLTRISHHSEISIILVNQNYFETKETTIARNMTTLIIFNHRSDSIHMANLSRRHLGSSNFLSNALSTCQKTSLQVPNHIYVSILKPGAKFLMT